MDACTPSHITAGLRHYLPRPVIFCFDFSTTFFLNPTMHTERVHIVLGCVSTRDLVFIGWEKYTIEPLNKYQQGHVWHWDACLFLVGYDHVTLGKKMIQLTHALGENISHTVVRSYIKSCAACHFFLTDPWHEQRWEKKQIIKHYIFDHVIMRMTGRSATLVTMTM